MMNEKQMLKETKGIRKGKLFSKLQIALQRPKKKSKKEAAINNSGGKHKPEICNQSIAGI